MNVRELAGEEKAAVWEEAKQFNAGYVVYEQRITTREIPVMLLSRQ
jgi:hypothetical protein